MKRTLRYLGAIIALTAVPAVWSTPIRIVASLPDLGSIASYVGNGQVEVTTIARSTSDPHSVEVLPSYMVQTSRAQLFLKVGLDLDRWADYIIEGSRNANLKIVDCSAGITVLEVPQGKVDASMGDVHPAGNPHYWLNPRNGVIIARTVVDALIAVDPENASGYRSRLEQFEREIAEKMSIWRTSVAALATSPIITYHSSWAYFADAFGFAIAAKVEPVPGIPPTASHLRMLTETIRNRNVKIVLQEPYFSDDAAHFLARETGVKVIKLSPSCSDVSAASYLRHFEEILEAIGKEH